MTVKFPTGSPDAAASENALYSPRDRERRPAVDRLEKTGGERKMCLPAIPKLSWADMNLEELLRDREVPSILLETVLEYLNSHPVFLDCEKRLWTLQERPEASQAPEFRDLLEIADGMGEYLLREGYRLGASSFIRYWGWDDPDLNWIDPLVEEQNLLTQAPYYRLAHLYADLLGRIKVREDLSAVFQGLEACHRLKWDLMKCCAFYAGYRHMTALAGMLGIFEEERTAARVDAWFLLREAGWQKALTAAK